MKYRKLPLQAELEDVKKKEGEAALSRVRSAYFLETARTKGFQFVTQVMRELEQQAMTALRHSDQKTDRLLGIIHAVEAIRNSLTALLPASERPHVDWLDDEQEDYLNVDDQTEEVWE